MVGTIVLTGATGGLASAYAKRLAEACPEHHLVFLVRNPASVKHGLLPTESPLVHYVGLDMTSVAGTHQAAEHIHSRISSSEWPPITSLICSAAVQITSSDQPRKTSDGYEESVAVNHLAHYILIRDLLPYIAKDGRIIIVGSEGHRPDFPYWPKATRYLPLSAQLETSKEEAGVAYANGLQRYGGSKLDQIMTGHELHRRLRAKSSAIQVLMLDPGSMATGLFRSVSTVNRIFLGWSLSMPWLLNKIAPGLHVTRPEQSAGMMLKLTTDNQTGVKALTPNGAPYWFSAGNLIETYGAANDEDLCVELWNDTARLLGYSTDI